MTKVSRNRKPRKALNLKYFVITLQEVIRMLTMKTVTTFYRNVIVFDRSINDTSPDFQPHLPVEIKILTEKDLPAYYTFRPNQCMNEIRKRLDREDKCFMVLHEGRMVHSSWVAREKVYVPYLRCNLILKPGEFYIYDNYTLPEYRNQGLAQTRSVYICKYYQGLGYHRAIQIVAVENETGLGMSKALGYQPIGLYGCIRIGPWQWDWQQSWGKESFPILTKATRWK